MNVLLGGATLYWYFINTNVLLTILYFSDALPHLVQVTFSAHIAAEIQFNSLNCVSSNPVPTPLHRPVPTPPAPVLFKPTRL